MNPLVLKGARTILVGAATAVAPAALTYFAGVDWTTLGVTAPVAFAISGAFQIAMRFITTTPVFKSE